MTESYDVIVVGSGAAGSVACDYLVSNGLRVLCLEKGDWIDKTQLPSKSFGWEALKRSRFSFNPNVRRAEADYDIECSDSPIDIANYCGVGGSTVLFSGHYPRFHPSDFCVKSESDVASDWPFSYEDLKPHYQANEEFIGVAGVSGDPAYPDLMTHLHDPVPIGPAGEQLVGAFEKLGWHWWHSYSAILTSDHENRNACSNSGPCNTGCHSDAKGSADVTFMRRALINGLTLKTRCAATSIIVASNGYARGIRYLDENSVHREVYGQKVILAANAIGTCRLLWDSSKKQFIGNSSNLIGRNFMVHPLGYVEGILPGFNDLAAGPQGSWIASHEFYNCSPERGFLRGYSLHFLRGAGPADVGFSSLIRNKLKLGDPLFVEKLRMRFSSTVGIAVICEDLPRANNKISMTQMKAPDGLPVPRVEYSLDANTKKMMAHGMGKAKQLLKKAGGQDIFGVGPIRQAGWHLCGTAKIGSDKTDSVVDVNGEMHDIKNLFIFDGSIFATSGGVNPAATIQAVSRFLAEKMLREFS